jgi:hypothetical protein
MPFDLKFSIVTISPFEPAFLLSLVTASVVAWLLGKGLGRLTSSVVDPWRRRLYMGPVWVGSGLVFFLLPNVFVAWAYPALHPEHREATVCVAMVWPTFLLPTSLGLWAAVRALRKGSPSPRDAPVA